ncbi:hypothetical protein D3C77_571310 [compost metagenome]
MTCKACRVTEVYRKAEAAAPVGPEPADVARADVEATTAPKHAFEGWMRKLRSDDRLPRGKYFAGKQGGLKAYQVGDYDVVAAYTPLGAIAMLCEHIGEELDAYDVDEVALVSDQRLDARKLNDQDLGRTVKLETSLRQDLNALDKPGYLFGWD